MLFRVTLPLGALGLALTADMSTDRIADLGLAAGAAVKAWMDPADVRLARAAEGD